MLGKWPNPRPRAQGGVSYLQNGLQAAAGVCGLLTGSCVRQVQSYCRLIDLFARLGWSLSCSPGRVRRRSTHSTSASWALEAEAGQLQALVMHNHQNKLLGKGYSVLRLLYHICCPLTGDLVKLTINLLDEEDSCSADHTRCLHPL